MGDNTAGASEGSGKAKRVAPRREVENCCNGLLSALHTISGSHSCGHTVSQSSAELECSQSQACFWARAAGTPPAAWRLTRRFWRSNGLPPELHRAARKRREESLVECIVCSREYLRHVTVRSAQPRGAANGRAVKSYADSLELVRSEKALTSLLKQKLQNEAKKYFVISENRGHNPVK
jgi:hypothetical protein